MGTDIHYWVERLDGGVWRGVGSWEKNEVHEPGDDTPPELFDSPITIYRNYPLFAVLADVCNEQGVLGGCLLSFFPWLQKQSATPSSTPDRFLPIARPRGLPTDLSPELLKMKAWLEASWLHSHSHVTLGELMHYDWDRQVTVKRFVPSDQADLYEQQGLAPTMTARHASGSHGMRQITITTTARQECAEFLEEVLPVLKSYGSPENVRLVFCFDS